MQEAKLLELATWITKAGLAGWSETEMMAGYCWRLRAAGVPLVGGAVVIATLPPRYECHAMRWRRDREETRRIEYGRTNQGEADESYRRSTFYHLVRTGETYLRRRLGPETALEFPQLDESYKAGVTDYLGIMNRFAAEGTVGDMDCVYS